MATSVDELIRAALEADPTVFGLVGAKVFPGSAPQGTSAPYIVYMVISDLPENTFDGNASNQLVNALVQIDCWGRKRLEAKQVVDAVDAVVSGLASPTLSAWRTATRNGYDNETQLHRASADFSAWLG